MKFKWEEKQGRYDTRHVCTVGRYPVGSVWYDSLRNREDPLAWAVKFNLPAPEGKVWTRRAFATVPEAKAYLEALVKVWFERAQED